MRKSWLAAALFVLGSAFAAVPANTIVIMEATDVPTLDPARGYDTASGQFIENIYETLLGYKGKSTTELEPRLATKWTVSGDGKTYTFTLRPSVKFHSGNTMSCDDAEYSFRRALTTNYDDAWVWFISQSLLGVGYANEYQEAKIGFNEIAKVAKCNASGQLVFTLQQRDPAFLIKMSFPGAAVVDKKAAVALGEWDGAEATWKNWVGKDLEASALSSKPSGTGAYQVVRKDAKTLVFKAFDGYWGGKPKIENVIYQQVEEVASRIEALKKGDADFIELGTRAQLQQAQGAPGVKVIDDLPDPVASAIFMNQNIKDPGILGSGKLDGNGIPANFFSDVNVRKAFSFSFDYARYIKEVQLGKGKQRTMLLPDYYLGYDPNVKKYTFDAKLAEAFFRKAWGGQVWQNGFKLIARYRANSAGSQTAMEILKANIEKLNPKFKVEIQAKVWSDFLKDSQAGKEANILLGWAADYADPDNFLYTFFHSQGAYNPRVNFKDTLMDGLLDQARSTTDTAKRKALYNQVGNRAYDQAYFIIVPRPIVFVVMRDEVKGVDENFNPLQSFVWGTYWKDLSK